MEAQKFTSTITVTNGLNDSCNASSILLLVGLGLRYGETVTIAVSGVDEQTAADRIVELFQTNFDFPRADP